MVHHGSQSIVALSSQLSHINGFLNNVGAFQDLVGSVHDLDFAGPLALVTGDQDLGAGNELGSFFLGASQAVDVVSALFILAVQVHCAIPPRLESLDVGDDGDFGIQRSSQELSVGHAGGLFHNGLVLGGVFHNGLVNDGLIGGLFHSGLVNDGSFRGLVAASDQANDHDQGQQQSNQFLHDK